MCAVVRFNETGKKEAERATIDLVALAGPVFRHMKRTARPARARQVIERARERRQAMEIRGLYTLWGMQQKKQRADQCRIKGQKLYGQFPNQ